MGLNPKMIVLVGVVTTAAIAVLVGIALLLASIGSSEPAAPGEPLRIVTNEGSLIHLNVEIAETPEQRSRGLSNRDEVPEGSGMLFVIPERGSGFWMKDTTVPLSVAFIADCGEIVDIQQMQPLTTELHNTDEDYGFGLEVPQGWFEANGITEGSIVSIPLDHRPDHC